MKPINSCHCRAARAPKATERPQSSLRPKAVSRPFWMSKDLASENIGSFDWNINSSPWNIDENDVTYWKKDLGKLDIHLYIYIYCGFQIWIKPILGQFPHVPTALCLVQNPTYQTFRTTRLLRLRVPKGQGWKHLSQQGLSKGTWLVVSSPLKNISKY